METSDQRPNSGSIDVNADISPCAGNATDHRILEATGGSLASELQSILADSKAVDLNDLCIIPGRFAWRINVDLLVNNPT